MHIHSPEDHSGIFTTIAEATSGKIGQEYFEALVSVIGELLEVDYAFISVFDTDSTQVAVTRAVYAKGALVDNFSYELEHTPCEQVGNQGICFYPCNIQELFPKDILLQEMSIEGYMGAALIDSHGKTMGVLVVLTEGNLPDRSNISSIFDIIAARTTAELERMLIEEELRKALRNAEEANLMKSNFLANLSHDFKTPLNAIIGYSDLMQQELIGPMGDVRYKDYASSIHHSGKLMLDLIDDVLNMAAIDARKKELKLTEVDLNSLIEEVLKDIAILFDQKELKTRTILEETLPSLVADRTALKQILNNLLSNSAKYTEKNGLIQISTTLKEGLIVLSVEDNGIGMSPELLAKVTEPFVQGQHNAHVSQSGTGLGLSIVKALVEMHSGNLHIESRLGEGTLIQISLPVHIDTQKAWFVDYL